MSWPEARVKLKVFWDLLSSVGWPPSSQLASHVALAVPMDRRGQTDRELLYKVFCLLSWLVWYILASASYKGGATAMAFGQVQGGMGVAPPLPPGTDTFKGSRATRTQHSGKWIPPRKQDGRPHLGLSRTPIPTRGPAGAPLILFPVKRVGHRSREESRGHVGGVMSSGLRDVPSSEPV